MTFPNQKTIIISKAPCDEYKNLYARINQKALQKAMLELNTMGEIKLWLYLSKNKPDYKLHLSCVECGKYGIKPDAYHAAVKRLIQKGYLQHISGNTYNFIELGTTTEKP